LGFYYEEGKVETHQTVIPRTLPTSQSVEPSEEAKALLFFQSQEYKLNYQRSVILGILKYGKINQLSIAYKLC
jgi:hypothetical protein